MAKDEKDQQPKHAIRVDVQTPVGDWTQDFEKTDKVGEVVQAALGHFGLAAGMYELRNVATGETLQADRTLVSYHLEDEAALMLIPQQGAGA